MTFSFNVKSHVVTLRFVFIRVVFIAFKTRDIRVVIYVALIKRRRNMIPQVPVSHVLLIKINTKEKIGLTHYFWLQYK